jgi:hypothetical protein
MFHELDFSLVDALTDEGLPPFHERDMNKEANEAAIRCV